MLEGSGKLRCHAEIGLRDEVNGDTLIGAVQSFLWLCKPDCARAPLQRGRGCNNVGGDCGNGWSGEE